MSAKLENRQNGTDGYGLGQMILRYLYHQKARKIKGFGVIGTDGTDNPYKVENKKINIII